MVLLDSNSTSVVNGMDKWSVRKMKHNMLLEIVMHSQTNNCTMENIHPMMESIDCSLLLKTNESNI